MKNKNQIYIKRKIAIIALAIAIIALITAIVTLAKYLNSTKEIYTNLSKNIVEEKNEENNIVIVDMPVDENPQENQEEIQQAENQPAENQPNNTENSNQETNKTTTSQDIKYYIKVNNQANVVTIYEKDANGKYTVPIKAMVCSIGTATPAAGNIYTIPGGKWDRYIWGQMVGGVWAQYYTRIKGSILFHSVPYTKKDKSALEYWEYDKLGTKASAGCIRLTVQDAKWIYDNCVPGTQVEFYADSNPGPLGKPTAQKISEESDSVRGWDPTDPSNENPWKTYETSSKTQESSSNKVTNDSSNISNTNNSNISNSNTISNEVKNDTEKNNITDTNTTNTTENNTFENNIIENNNVTENNELPNNITENSTTINNTVENNTTTENTDVNNDAKNNENTKNTVEINIPENNAN